MYIVKKRIIYKGFLFFFLLLRQSKPKRKKKKNKYKIEKIKYIKELKKGYVLLLLYVGIYNIYRGILRHSTGL